VRTLTPPTSTTGPPYLSLGRWRKRHRPGYFVERDTELVIEGFGRAGSTFAWFAFRSAQERPVRVSHHTHAAAQVITAVRWGVPTLILVRPAVDAALSHMTRHGVSARSALVAWVRFHERILPVQHGFVAASFDDMTHDFGAVTRRLNARFGTAFGVFDHTEANAERIFAEIRQRNRTVWGEHMTPNRARALALPTPERQALKDRLRAELDLRALESLRRRADALYGQIITPETPRPEGGVADGDLDDAH
jgi:hypothetical protein